MRQQHLGIVGDIEGNWKKLLDVVAGVCSNDLNLTRILGMMASLEGDVEIKGSTPSTIYLGFKRAPAAMRNHHNYEGGLVTHLLEMWNLWEWKFKTAFDCDPQFVSDERVLKQILFHDLHKAYCTYILHPNRSDWSVTYGDHRSDTMLGGNDLKTLWLLQKYGIELDLEQMNALLLSEGGYSKIRPKVQTVLSKIGYLLDEASGNVLARAEKRTYIELDRREP